MDIQALAPGVRMALSALGFKPEQIVGLMTNIGDGIKQVNAQLAEIRNENALVAERQIEILERLSRLENANAPALHNERPADAAGSDDADAGRDLLSGGRDAVHGTDADAAAAVEGPAGA